MTEVSQENKARTA